MKKLIKITFIIITFFSFPSQGGAEDCSRLVSIAPSITEILYSIGLGSSIEGLTTYCRYPPDALRKIKVGGYLDPNYEVMLGLKPTLVFHLKEQREIAARLNQLGIKTKVLDHSNISGILQSILYIGNVCGVEKNANELHNNLKTKLDRLIVQANSREKKRVLLAVGRTDINSLQGIYAAGNDGFLSELLKIAGAKNVNLGSTINFPAISSENLITTNPEVIIEIIALPEMDNIKNDVNSSIIQSWGKFKDVDAVKNKKIFLLSHDYMTIPGPRFALALEEIIKTLNQN